MSARQAFVPRPPSRLPSSEPHAPPADARARDGDQDMFNGHGKPRSISAFLGQKRGGPKATSQGPGLGRTNTSANRRSFEGILRPEMTPISIIPYPPTTERGTGMKQPGAGQTPRKTAGPGGFEFTRPMTPASVPRGFKKGLVAENRDDEVATNESVHGGGAAFTDPEAEADLPIGVGTGTGGYMRMFEGSGGDGNPGGLRSSLERDVAVPVPGYALGPGGLGADMDDEGNEIAGIFARSSMSLGSMAEEDVGLDKIEDSQRSLGTKRRMRHEDVEESGRYSHEGPQAHGSAKRTKQPQHDPNEYIPISSPHVPPAPGPASPVNIPDSSLVVGSLLENIEEIVSLERVEADWKRWRECTTEEWLKGADAFAQEYTDILNMVKDHLTEKVLAYASMISSVEEKQTEVKRNIEMIHGKGKIVQENISKLGSRK